MSTAEHKFHPRGFSDRSIRNEKVAKTKPDGDHVDVDEDTDDSEGNVVRKLPYFLNKEVRMIISCC